MHGAHIDALLVLGGEDRHKLPRCSAALHFYRACCTQGIQPPKLIVSGGKLVLHQAQWISESALMAKFLLQHGIPPGDVLTEAYALNTLGNILLGGALAASQGLVRLAIVTDDFHHWRSRRLFKQVFGVEPQGCIPTGVRGSWRARIREGVAFSALMLSLKVSRVASGSPQEHKRFLSRNQHLPDSIFQYKSGNYSIKSRNATDPDRLTCEIQMHSTQRART